MKTKKSIFNKRKQKYFKSYNDKKFSLEIKLGNLCNNKCSICSLLGKKSIKNKSLAEIKKELEQIRKEHSELIISGGEPTLREDLFDVIKYAKQLGFVSITLRTNGRMLSYMNYCKRVAEAGIDNFDVYIYGHKPELHDSITRVEGSFEQTVEGIKNLVSLGQNVQASVLINRMNYKELINIVNFLNFLNISELRFIYPEPTSKNKKIFEKLIPEIRESAEFIAGGRNLAKKFGMKILPNEIKYQLNPNFRKSLEKKPQLKFKFEKYKGIKKVSIIIPTCNRKKLLKNTLISLFKQDYPKKDYEIIVVDDGSTDNTEKMIRSLKPTCNLKYYYWPRYKEFVPGSPENRAGPARNIGIEESEGEVIIFIDSDIICDPKLIAEHLKYHNKSSKLVVIGYRKELPEVPYQLDIKKARKLDKKTFDDIREIDYSKCSDDLSKLGRHWTLFYSNNISVRKEHLVNAGMFDENFVFWGVEDQEMGYKLFHQGLKFELNRNALCYHQFHPAECKDLENQIKALKYNGITFYKKYLDMDIFNNYRFFIEYDAKSIKLDNACNNNCIVCGLLDKKSTKKSLAEIKKELEQIRKEHSELIISGGEPTLREDLFDVIKYARGLGFHSVTLRTNGRMLSYMNYCKRVAEAGVDNFDVYIYSHKPELHDSITGVRGSFEQTVEGIKNLVSLGQNVQASVLINRMNYKHLTEILRFLSVLKINYVLFLNPDTSYGTKKMICFNLKDYISPPNELGRNLESMMNYYFKNGLNKEIKLGYIGV